MDERREACLGERTQGFMKVRIREKKQMVFKSKYNHLIYSLSFISPQ